MLIVFHIQKQDLVFIELRFKYKWFSYKTQSNLDAQAENWKSWKITLKCSDRNRKVKAI